MKKPFANRVMFFIQRRTHNIQARNILSKIIGTFLPKSKNVNGVPSFNITKTQGEIFQDLNQDGFSDLGFVLSDKEIEVLINELEKIDCYDMDSKDIPKVDILSPDKDIQLAHYKREDLVKLPEIVKIANHSRVLNAVSEYLGVKPTISNINCWWSFGNREVAKEAQFYHRDMDDFKFIKMFLYLTDVDETMGPHIYVRGSHKTNKLTELRRFSDKEIADNFNNEDIMVLTKEKGACFIEDTYGIHKGQLPEKGNRLLLQIQYSVLPLHVEDYQPQQTSLVDTLGLDPYVNRLLFNTKH